jgi:hypothetical protein
MRMTQQTSLSEQVRRVSGWRDHQRLTRRVELERLFSPTIEYVPLLLSE